MFACPKCDNTFDIVHESKINADLETPTSVSNTEDDNDDNNEDNQKKPIKNQNKQKDDLGNKFYFRCTNCSYIEQLRPNTLISKKTIDTSTDKIIDEDNYKNMIHDRTLPRTRKYVCPNDKCVSQKDYSKREAVWFKPDHNTYKIIYVCSACQTAW